MLVLLEIIAVNAIVGLACYARGLYIELKSTKKKLQSAQETNKFLVDELQKFIERG